MQKYKSICFITVVVVVIILLSSLACWKPEDKQTEAVLPYASFKHYFSWVCEPSRAISCLMLVWHLTVLITPVFCLSIDPWHVIDMLTCERSLKHLGNISSVMLHYIGYVLRYLSTDTGDVNQVCSLEGSALKNRGEQIFHVIFLNFRRNI